MRPRLRLLPAAAALGLAVACGDADPKKGPADTSAPDPTGDATVDGEPDAGLEDTLADAGSSDGGPTGGGPLPYAENVVEFSPGPNAGFGQEDLPEVVLGPPEAVGAGGSLDVLSLGVGGEIILDFGDRDVVDGPGSDLVIFENAFHVGGDPTRVFAELGEVAVSVDGKTWTAFDCDPEGQGMGRFPGCAGWTPTRTYDPETLVPLVPELSGGDAFDLFDIGLQRARFVRIRDLAEDGAGRSAGFDLDAVGAVHLAPRP